MIQIAAFWKKESKNNRTYYEKQPNLILYIVQDKGKQGSNESAQEADISP